MDEIPASQLRIGNSDREAALEALAEHMRVGRIDLDEYGERSARVNTVKTRGELAELFADLPNPHPLPAEITTVEHTPSATPAVRRTDLLAQRAAALALPVASIIAIALFFITRQWWWFLIPAAVTMIGGSLWNTGRLGTSTNPVEGRRFDPPGQLGDGSNGRPER